MDLLKMLETEQRKLREQTLAIGRAIGALKGATKAAAEAYVQSVSKPRKKLSTAARKRISLAQKARWAKHRKAKVSAKKSPARTAA